MRILLVNPPCEPKTIGLRHIAKLEPLGLELIGAGVKGLHEVRLVDMEVAPRDLQKTLDEYEPDVVGVTSEIVHRNTALEVLRTVRDRYPRCLRVVGGHHPTMRPEDFADPVVDLIVVGEGVESFRQICALRERGETDYSSISGLAIPVGHGKVTRTAARSLPTHLDDYPFPDRSLTKRYRKKYFYLTEKSGAAVRTSFGCTHHCIFCSVRVYSNGGFIPRSAEKVFEEIRSLEEEFVVFCDDHSFIDPERMRKVAEMLIAAGVKKRYFVYARTDSIVQHRDVFALWAKAGLSLVMSGLEAIDEKALKRAGKRVGADVNDEAVRIAEELGFKLSAGFLVEPGFQREDFEKIDQYVKARPSILITEYTPLTPFPGTPLYRQVRKDLLTHDPALYDLQHFVLPTRMPAQALYRLQFEYYGRSIRRVMAHLLRHEPSALFSLHAVRLLVGLYRNGRAYKTAHVEIPDRRPPDAQEELEERRTGGEASEVSSC
ncbi:MAG: cobalamin-dependent protein [Bdellovibrionales bacterium]|nr:cobalamin-dependent protein [Bdellovibrionales bacterium]